MTAPLHHLLATGNSLVQIKINIIQDYHAVSENEPKTSPVLAPTWLIVCHLLGAAVMLYFVSNPPIAPNSETVEISPVINVAELRSEIVTSSSTVTIVAADHRKITQEQRVVD